jgi:hypothetical protein
VSRIQVSPVTKFCSVDVFFGFVTSQACTGGGGTWNPPFEFLYTQEFIWYICKPHPFK